MGPVTSSCAIKSLGFYTKMKSTAPDLCLSVLVLSCCFLLALVDGCQDEVINSPCNQTVFMDNLGDLVSAEFPAGSTVCVELEPGTGHTLSYTATPLMFNVDIQGNGNTVVCAQEDLGTDYTQFPLYFYNSTRVVIRDLHFERCQRPILFEEVQSVIILSSTFTNFYPGGTVDVYNSPNLCIQDSLFQNGTSMGYKTEQFSGNSGGIAVGYSKPYQIQDDVYYPQITLRKSRFESNSANAVGDFLFTVLEVLTNKTYNQRGGGVAFLFGASNYSGVVSIEGCTFTNNFARDSGGGVYAYLGGANSTHTVTISDTMFIGNEAQDGGGVEITHANSNSFNSPNSIVVTNCTFDGNKGKFGGGYKNIQVDDLSNSNKLLVKDTRFVNNSASVGAGIYLQAVVTVVKTTLKRRIDLEDCTFTNNVGKRGVVFIIGNVVTISGSTTLERSTGPALRILGTLVVLQGDIMFRENRHHPEGFSGALYLSSFGQIILYPSTNITFLNNTGSEGACLVVRGQLIAAAFTKQLYNPQCFLQYYIPTEPLYKWNVSMTFEGNRATVGPVVLMSDATICLWNDSSSPFFASTTQLEKIWTFMEMRNNYVNGSDISESYIQTGIFNLSLTTENITAYPGELVHVDATALDQFGSRTSGFIGISAVDSMEEIQFEPSIVPISPLQDGVKFMYFGNTSSEAETTVELNPFFTSEENNENFTLRHRNCQPGHTLNPDTKVCECNMNLREEIIFCMENGTGLLLANGLWGGQLCDQLATYQCPPSYCDCTDKDSVSGGSSEGCPLIYDSENSLCNSNRKGVLCGECASLNGTQYGVGLLTTTCQKHQGRLPHFWLFPIYIVALVITLVLLVKRGVHLPSSLRGFLFYIQVVPIAVAYFPSTFKPNINLAYCVSSTLALYVPYDFTFHEGMTALESYGLRYITPLIALIVVPIAARVRHHRFKYWHGIWTIILLMYVMTVETSVSLLFCPSLKNVQNCPSASRVWFFDGSVKCYTGWHIPLTIVALLILLAQALLVVFVAAVIYYKTLRKKYVKFEQLERFSVVVTHGIKHEYKWWPIVELSCRFIFVMSAVLTPGYVVVPLVLGIIIFVMQTVIHPYRSKLANYMESVLFLWLVCLLALGNTTELESDGPKWLLEALLYIPIAWGGVVLGIRCILLTRKKLLPHKDQIKKKLKMTTSNSVAKVQSFTVSYSTKKRKLINQSDGPAANITETVVGLDDEHDTQERNSNQDVLIESTKI